MFNDFKLTLLEEDQIWGNNKLDVLSNYGIMSALTDLAILTGAYCSSYHVEEDSSLKGRTGWYFTKTTDNDGDALAVDYIGTRNNKLRYDRKCAIRPALPYSNVIQNISRNVVRENNVEILCGEYPQYAVDENFQNILENKYNSGTLIKSGKKYVFDSTKYDDYDKGFNPVEYEEFVYNGEKYIRVKANSCYSNDSFTLSNGNKYKNGDYVWVKVEPVSWFYDKKENLLLSKRLLLGGIRFHEKASKYNGDFDKTETKMFLDKYMSKELFSSVQNVANMSEEEKTEYIRVREELEKKKNPYGLNFEGVSEEEIITGALESDVAVFLHGQSSEGKSARVKKIDPTCEIIYLRNVTPDRLNGKSVYVQPIVKRVEVPVSRIIDDPEGGEKREIKTIEYQDVIVKEGYMLDIKPTWLVNVEEKCRREPDRIHIVFFDEITNALQSIQGMAFNIILDKEVNGIWKLPENVRLVAAGNEMKDSLAANQLAEPLFNRFAHVYIKTTTEGWLKWASENNIHPAIYSYIAYTNGEALRSKYNGEKPNADPRKWEMASKMLYKTGRPEMLRSLVGDEITKDFVQFCNQSVITLQDVLSDNYNETLVKNLNTAEKYATTMCMIQADEENFEKVRKFVSILGGEFRSVFDSLWARGDEKRLELIMEADMVLTEGGKVK